MVELTTYKCPELFVLFKYNLKLQTEFPVTFKLARDESIDDIKRFLTKKEYQFDVYNDLNYQFVIIKKEPCSGV